MRRLRCKMSRAALRYGETAARRSAPFTHNPPDRKQTFNVQTLKCNCCHGEDFNDRMRGSDRGEMTGRSAAGFKLLSASARG